MISKKILFHFLLIFTFTLCCEKPHLERIYVPESITKELIVGLWKNDSIPELPDRSDDSGVHCVYFLFNDDYSCTGYLTTGLGFHDQFEGTYSINSVSSEIKIVTNIWPEIILNFSDHLYLYSYRFKKISDTDEIENWSYKITLVKGSKVKNLDLNLYLEELSFKDSFFYSLCWQRNILKFDYLGNVLIDKFIPEYTTPPRNFIHHPRALTSHGDFIYVSMICETNCHEIYKFDSDSLNLIERMPIDVTSHAIEAIAVDSNNIMWAVGNGWMGDVRCYLHGVDLENGQEIIQDYQINIIANGLIYYKGLLWGVRDRYSKYFLKGFDPYTGRIKYSIKLEGIQSLLQLDQCLGITFIDSTLYFLNGLNQTMYYTQFPVLN